jgi:hypothetical protein
MELREVEWGDVDWFHQTRAKDQWKALVNKMMNLGVP